MSPTADHWDRTETCASQQEATWRLMSSDGFPMPCFFLSPILEISAMASSILWQKGYFWVCKRDRPVGLLFFGRPDSTKYLPIFGSTFGMENFPAERRKLNWMASLMGSCYSCPYLECISMKSDLRRGLGCAVHGVTESVGSSGKNGGLGIHPSSG